MKSIKLIRAMGGISDSFIEEAADPIRTGDGDFQEAVEISAPKRKIRLFPVISFAALFALAIAAVFIAQTAILNKPFDINDLLSSHGEITEVGILISDNVNVDDKEAPEYVKELKKGIGELFANTRHTLSEVPELSKRPEAEYVLFLQFSDREFIRVFLYEDVYYILEKDNTTYGCKGDSAEYKQLTELVKNYASLLKAELKVTAELDGYEAEQVIEYMAFVLNVTFPDGETAEVRTELGDFGDLDHQIQMSVSPETEIFKLEHNGKTEYVIMQKVSYDGEGNKKVIFFGCDAEKHRLIRYKNNDSNTNVFTVSDAFTQGEEGNIFYDSKLEQKLGFNLETRTVDLTEYFSWERETPEMLFSDIGEYFDAEKLTLDLDADIRGAIDGDLLYYYSTEAFDGYKTGRMTQANMITGEKRTVIEENFTDSRFYTPICVQNGCLYYIYSTDGAFSAPVGIYKLDLSGGKPVHVYSPQTVWNIKTAPAENGFYFYDTLNDTKKIYFLNTSDDSVTTVLNAADSFFAYKNGIVYSLGDGVFYRGEDELYCIGTEENGDKKLFELSEPREYFYQYIYCNGEYLALALPYDIYTNWWHASAYAIMLYDEKSGLKPLGKAEYRLLRSDCGGGGELLRINSLLCDMGSGRFFDMPYYWYEPVPDNSYDIRFNYSEGKLYCMVYRCDYVNDVYQCVEAEFYRLAGK